MVATTTKDYLKNKIKRTCRTLEGMTNYEVAELLVRAGVYIIPKDKERLKLIDLEKRFIIKKVK